MTRAAVDRPVVLVIGGSDPIGAAGIQADLRHLAALGVHGAAVPTALTVQRIDAVESVHVAPPDVVRKSLEAVEETFEPAAVLLSMLATEPVAREVLLWLHKIHVPVVLDPVFRASSGAPLLDDAGFELVRDFLVPRADLTLPNLDELARLSGVSPEDVLTEEGRGRALEALIERGAPAVLSKGWHLPGADLIDLLHDGVAITRLSGSRVAGRVRGAGGAMAAACAAFLARGFDLGAAAKTAHDRVQAAISRAAAAGSPFLHLQPEPA